MTSLCSGYPAGELVDDALRSCLMEAGSTSKESQLHYSSWEAWIQFMRMSHEQFLDFIFAHVQQETRIHEMSEQVKANKSLAPFLDLSRNSYQLQRFFSMEM